MSSLSLQDQALRELGRTVYNYQKFEVILKAVMSRANISAKNGDMEDVFEKLHTSTSGQTLGALVNRLADTIYAAPHPDKTPTITGEEVHFSFECRRVFESDKALERHIDKLKEVILSRNILIHHSAAQLKLDSDDACRAFIADLKEQNNKLTPFYEEFQRKLKGMIDFMQALADNPELLMPELGPWPDTIQIGDDTFHKKSQSPSTH